jgi:hypothetical protein
LKVGGKEFKGGNKAAEYFAVHPQFEFFFSLTVKAMMSE